MNRYSDAKPGSLKHKILIVLGNASGTMSQPEIVAAVVSDGTRIKADAIYHMHLRPMIASELISESENDNGGSFVITLDGRLELKELNSALAGRPKEGLVPSRKGPIPKGDYAGDELKRNPGLPADRYAAFDLPSVALGWRVWPKHLENAPAPEKVSM